MIVLGYDVWQRAFGGDPTVIGRKIHLDAMPVTVIGVMPKGFDFLDREEAWVAARLRSREGEARQPLRQHDRAAQARRVAAALRDELELARRCSGRRRGAKLDGSRRQHPDQIATR